MTLSDFRKHIINLDSQTQELAISTELCDKEFADLADFISSGNFNSKILTLKLKFISEIGCSHITSALLSNSCLAKLSLIQCGITPEKMKILAKGIAGTTTLQQLDLSGNFLTDKGGVVLANALSKNNSVTTLTVICNGFGSRSAKAFENLIKSNTKIKSFSAIPNGYILTEYENFLHLVSKPVWETFSSICQIVEKRKEEKAKKALRDSPAIRRQKQALDPNVVEEIEFSELIRKEEIGSGAYGKVYRGEFKGNDVAIKILSSAGQKEFFHELAIMKKATGHPNVVQLYAMCTQPPVICMVMELIEGGSLDKLLPTICVDPELILKIAIDIAHGVEFLHSREIIHRDLATRNVLVDEKGPTFKVCDFGYARLDMLKSNTTQTNMVPVQWTAPEGFPGKDRSAPCFVKKSDSWSFANTVIELLLGNSDPYPDHYVVTLGTLIRDKGLHPSRPRNCPDVLWGLLLKCWKMNPDERPSMTEIVQELEQINSNLENFRAQFTVLVNHKQASVKKEYRDLLASPAPLQQKANRAEAYDSYDSDDSDSDSDDDGDDDDDPFDVAI
eukprot:TRINITY_DN477_c0_g3_i2.p1 TRINITY_DN477_c0_g3~~TRINITY_DN477_c0_g3_i2.p1  ORF type:complete len:632 (+),score=109.88 TRINITY_DN477_c0_g3_i2:219-1898(+)